MLKLALSLTVGDSYLCIFILITWQFLDFWNVPSPRSPPSPPVGAFHPWLQIKLSDCQHFPELLRTKSTSKQKIKFPAESWRGCKINTMIEAFGCRCHNVLIIVGGVCTAACLQVFFSLSVCLAHFGWRRIIFCNVLTAWTSKHSSEHLV